MCVVAVFVSLFVCVWIQSRDFVCFYATACVCSLLLCVDVLKLCLQNSCVHVDHFMLNVGLLSLLVWRVCSSFVLFSLFLFLLSYLLRFFPLYFLLLLLLTVFQVQFDCRLTPLLLKPVDLAWVATEWAHPGPCVWMCVCVCICVSVCVCVWVRMCGCMCGTAAMSILVVVLVCV